MVRNVHQVAGTSIISFVLLYFSAKGEEQGQGEGKGERQRQRKGSQSHCDHWWHIHWGHDQGTSEYIHQHHQSG